MNASRKRTLLVASFIWVVLIGAGAYLAFPSLGQMAASIHPNPFWNVEATGIATAPFRVELKTSSWLAWTLVPVLLMWLCAALPGRRASGNTSA